MKKISLYLLGIVALLSSCGGDDEEPADTTAPVIDAVTIEGTNVLTSMEETEVHLEEDFTFAVTVSDDRALSQMMVEVHEAFDDHSHARLAVKEAVVIAEPAADTLSFGPVIKTLSGTSQTESFNVFTSTEEYTAGEYHIEVVVLDAEGNRTVKVVEFHLEDPHADHVH